jgi:MFS family permease
LLFVSSEYSSITVIPPNSDKFIEVIVSTTDIGIFTGDNSTLVGSVSDVARLINTRGHIKSYARMIVFLALGGVFLDAYDLTTLSYGIDDVVRDFGLTPTITGVVTSSIMVGTIFGNLLGGWLTDKYGRYSIFMADMLFFVISAIVGGLSPNVWVLIGARFLMPVAMAYLAEFSKFAGKGNKAARLAAWCPMWYAASSACFFLIFGLYFLLPKEHIDWLWRASLLFSAVPALLIIAVRRKFMNESPLWAANQGDLTAAVRILRDSYGINAHEDTSATPAPVAAKSDKVSFRVLFEKPYRERTIVAGVMNVCIAFEYTAIAFFLPSILAQFLGAGVFETISASLGLNALFAFTGGLLGMRLAWKYPSRHVAIAGFALQFVALVSLALIGRPEAAAGIIFAILMLVLWLFAEGFGPGAQLMIYPALSYPTSIRATGVGFSRSLSGIGSALALFILPILKAALGTNMFWAITPFAFVPIIFLLAVRYEPTRQDIDDQTTETADQAVVETARDPVAEQR